MREFTAIGYIKPQFLINDFVTVVYESSNEEKYIYDGNLFVKWLQNDVQIQKFEKRITDNSVNDNVIYCYLQEDGSEIIGNLKEIFHLMVELLQNSELNEFAKLSIAIFLGFTGIKVRTIESLRIYHKKNRINLTIERFEFSEYENLNINDADLIKAWIENYRLLLRKYKGLVNWKDVIYLKNDFVFFNVYKCDYRCFQKVIQFAREIIKNIIMSDSYISNSRLMRNSPEIYEVIKDDKEFIKEFNSGHFATIEDFWQENENAPEPFVMSNFESIDDEEMTEESLALMDLYDY